MVTALIGIFSLSDQVLAQSADSEQTRMELRQARQAMEEAAREVARLSTQFRGQVMGGLERGRHNVGRRAMLGISISDASDGIRVDGVTPGGPASEVGIQSGDFIIALDGAQLVGDSPSELLINQMQNYSPGDAVTLTVVRDNTEQDIQVITEGLVSSALNDQGPRGRPQFFGPRFWNGLKKGDPKVGYGGRWKEHLWSDMELVGLTPELSSYFGTDVGILVVRAPSNVIEILDGDVILQIGTRIPLDTEHAWRVLKSFEEGENLELTIMRGLQRQMLEIELGIPQPAQLD